MKKRQQIKGTWQNREKHYLRYKRSYFIFKTKKGCSFFNGVYRVGREHENVRIAEI